MRVVVKGYLRWVPRTSNAPFASSVRHLGNFPPSKVQTFWRTLEPFRRTIGRIDSVFTLWTTGPRLGDQQRNLYGETMNNAKRLPHASCAGARACDASLAPGKQRNDSGNPGISSLGEPHQRALPASVVADRGFLITTTSHRRTGDRLDWTMLAIWVFVVFSFAALVFAGYLIRAKCEGHSPF
jgi:hypothetical protein